MEISMSSKRRIRRRSCESKVRHENADEASKHARRLGKHYMQYHCAFCNGWHVGRPDRATKQGLIAKAQYMRV